MARPLKKIQVSQQDQAQLESWLRAHKTRRSLAQRARIILLSSQGMSVPEVARTVGMHPSNVYVWRQRYERQGVEGLQDRPRPGQPRKLSADKARDILHTTVHRIPRESTHWSLRLMARCAQVTVHQVRQVWKAADLRPHC